MALKRYFTGSFIPDTNGMVCRTVEFLTNHKLNLLEKDAFSPFYFSTFIDVFEKEKNPWQHSFTRFLPNSAIIQRLLIFKLCPS